MSLICSSSYFDGSSSMVSVDVMGYQLRSLVVRRRSGRTGWSGGHGGRAMKRKESERDGAIW